MNVNRKSPRAFRTSSSATQPGSPHSDSRYHSRMQRCSGSEPVGGGNIGFRVAEKNDSVKKEYAEVLRQTGLLTEIVINGFEKTYQHSSPNDKEFLNTVKNENIEALMEALYERRGALSKQLYIRD